MLSKSEATHLRDASETLVRLATASRMQGTNASAETADAFGLGAFHSSCTLAIAALAAVLSDAAVYLDSERARDVMAER